MEEFNKTSNHSELIEKLKTDDPKAEALLRDFRNELLEKHMSKLWEVHAGIGKLYEDAGLLEKAKNAYYNAYAHAEKSSEMDRAEELLAKSKSLPGEIED